MMPMMMGLAVCAEPMVELLLTEKWLFCVPYLRIFCFTYSFYPIHTANLNAIKAMGRSDLFLKLEIIKKAVGLAFLLSSIWFGVMAMAYTLLITSVISQIINSWPNKKLLGYSYLEQLKDIFVSQIEMKIANALSNEELSSTICRVLKDEGYKITSVPRLTINNGKLYAVVGLNTGLRVIEIKGEQVPEMITTILAMNNSYNVSLNNIGGYSNAYESSFAYNGVDMYTGESVWLSLPDDTKKANLSNGISMYETLCNDRGVILECSNPFDLDKPTKSERAMLESLGYTSSQAKNARVQEAYITLLNKNYTK